MAVVTELLGRPALHEYDGIRVEVQHLFGVESAESFSVEFESGSTRGEADNKDVDIDLNGILVFDVFVDHFDHFVVHDAKGLKFLAVVLEELMQSGWGRNGFHFALVCSCHWKCVRNATLRTRVE